MKKTEKKIEKVYFIESKSPSSHIFIFVKIFRLGSIILATILKIFGFQAKVYIEDIKEVYDENKDEITKKELFEADMVCVSTITSTAIRGYKIAEKFREKNIPVAIGGPHVTFLPDEGLEHADYVIRGEGEETLVELINCLNHNSRQALHDILGLSFKTAKEKTVHNPDRPLVKDLDAAPIPDFGLIADWDDKNVIPIATSRGCTFACRFCSVIQMFGQGMRFKSVGRVIEELKAALKYDPRHIFFIDDNFAANKKRAKEICQAIIDNNLQFEWSAQVRTDVIDNLGSGLVDLMVKAGCVNVFVGFESINQEMLEKHKKKQDLEKITRCIKVLKEAGMNIHGMFVIDPDTDTIQTIQDTLDYVRINKIDSIQFLILTPLPGTPIFEEIKDQGRLIHTDWSKYDAHHETFYSRLPVGALQVVSMKAMKSFYGWPYSIKWLLSPCLIPLDGRAWIEGFFYAWIGMYGRRTTREALKKTSAYLDAVRVLEKELEAKIKMLREKEKCVSVY